MAEARMDHTYATEKILEWYHTLRVDHLSPSEMDFELDIRSIIIRDDPTYSRRRRSLRDHLKNEKENHKTIEVKLEVNWEETVQFCQRYYSEISAGFRQKDKNLMVRGQAKLLHFGHRIVLLLQNSAEAGEGENFLKAMLVEVVKLLNLYFYSESVTLETEIEEDTDGQPLSDLFRVFNEHPAQPISHVVTGTRDLVRDVSPSGNFAGCSHVEDRAFMLTLLDRIEKLQLKLDERDKQLEEHINKNKHNRPSENQQELPNRHPFTQSTSSSNHFTTTYPSNSQCFTAASTSRPIPSTTYTIPQSYPTSFPQPPTSWHNYFPITTTTQPLGSTLGNHSWSGFPPAGNPPSSNAWLGSSALNSGSTSNPWLGNPSVVYSQSSNPWIGTQIPTSIPQVNPTFTHFTSAPSGNPMRHTLPVSKWTISKYDGEDQGLKLNQFLGMVHTMALAEHVSDVELFESAIHLFKGPALQWYMTMRTTGRLLNWQHLVLELRRTFMHPDLDTLIKMKVYQRHQYRHETFLQYYHGMEELFGTMSIPLPEYEKMQILLQNMRIEYKKQLNFLPIADLPTLVSAGQKIDAINFSVYNKVFGPDKAVHVVDNSSSNTIAHNDPSTHRQDKKSVIHPPSQPNRTANTNPLSSHTQQHRQRSQNGDSTSREPIRPPSTLEDMIQSHQPLSRQHCYNCGKFGHKMARCRLPKGVLCENCGFRGYPSDNCPYCIKNELSAGQNRRPLNQNF